MLCFTIIMQGHILDFAWYILANPSYSADLASNDFYLISSQQNALNNKNFFQEDRLKMFMEII